LIRVSKFNVQKLLRDRAGRVQSRLWCDGEYRHPEAAGLPWQVQVANVLNLVWFHAGEHFAWLHLRMRGEALRQERLASRKIAVVSSVQLQPNI
jgi:hypothetical protein